MRMYGTIQSCHPRVHSRVLPGCQGGICRICCVVRRSMLIPARVMAHHLPMCLGTVGGKTLASMPISFGPSGCALRNSDALISVSRFIKLGLSLRWSVLRSQSPDSWPHVRRGAGPQQSGAPAGGNLVLFGRLPGGFDEVVRPNLKPEGKRS